MKKKKKVQIVSRFNFDPALDSNFEINVLPSETVPDMAPELGELAARYMRGQSVPTLPGAIYDSDQDELPIDFSRWDKISKIEYMRRTERALGEHMAALKN